MGSQLSSLELVQEDDDERSCLRAGEGSSPDCSSKEISMLQIAQDSEAASELGAESSSARTSSAATISRHGEGSNEDRATLTSVVFSAANKECIDAAGEVCADGGKICVITGQPAK